MRVKTGFARKRFHKKILKATKGFRGAKSKLYRKAHEAFIHAGAYAFAGRKDRKSQFRELWIKRINAALQPYNIKYSRFISSLKSANIKLDRKTLSRIAVENPSAFKAVVEQTTK